MSLLRDFYYDVKPFLPFPLRMAFRRALARFQLSRSASRWPIFPPAGIAPAAWPGWPNGKKFALVLTHDVEGPRGLQQCDALIDLELKHGVRSSFNFVPEGSYRVGSGLLRRLKTEGFEIGVHDLHHNGKLYRNKKLFDAAAPRINDYLRQWGAVGFRSGFMHRNLEWLHALDIDYDMSTFDTDPFEPQPDGAHTIFPFWVPQSVSNNADAKDGAISSRLGYVELPYTLPQDSTLFLLLKERNINIWKQKLDWIAERGGMALINVHPDYLNCSKSAVSNTFPAAWYEELLQYVRAKYDSVACYRLPREVAAFVKSFCFSDIKRLSLNARESVA